MYFPLRMDPLDVAEARLRGLRLSLNGPVVQAEALPVGPARAAIVVHDEPDGRPNVTVAVRSLRSGEVVLYSFEGDLREHSSLAVGLDAALSFGESMGFLFDDDELEGDAGARALAYERLVQWLEGPVASLPGPGRTPSPPPPAAEDAAEELLLEQTLEPVSEPSLPPAAPRGGGRPPVRPAPEAGSRPRATGQAKPMLSKFRGRSAVASPGEAASPKTPHRPRRESRESGSGAAPLGRVRLVKRRADGTAPPEDRPSFLFRLLALF